jgi:4-nitrophenyl phosphatase
MIDQTYHIASIIKGLILDMDGVLWRDNAPLGDLPEIFRVFSELGLRVVLATNNASRDVNQYIDKLLSFGVRVEPWQIVTSGVSTVHYLKELHPDGGEVYILGSKSLIDELNRAGFYHGGEKPLAVVAALDREITYGKLMEASLLIQHGVPFVGTNPDKSFPIPGGEAPGTGAILAALEATTRVSPIIIGKPETRMYSVALEHLGTKADTTLAVGDRLETDILGAQKTGLFSALVLSGISTPDDVKKWEFPPDIITNDITSLVELLQQARQKP